MQPDHTAPKPPTHAELRDARNRLDTEAECAVLRAITRTVEHPEVAGYPGLAVLAQALVALRTKILP